MLESHVRLLFACNLKLSTVSSIISSYLKDSGTERFGASVAIGYGAGLTHRRSGGYSEES
jgi:hypothetical protein